MGLLGICFLVLPSWSIFILPFPFKFVPGVSKGKQKNGFKLKI